MRLEFTKKRKLTRKVCGQEITIVPYIDIAKKQVIIEKLTSYFQESIENEEAYGKIICEMRANYDVLVIKLNTDVEILPEDSYEDLASSGLIDVVRESVFNYDEVYNDAAIVLSMLKLASILPQADSIGDTFTKLADVLENMDDKQKANFEIFIKAAMANAANTEIMRSAKAGE